MLGSISSTSKAVFTSPKRRVHGPGHGMCSGSFLFLAGVPFRGGEYQRQARRVPYGVPREVAAPAAGAHGPPGHSELCPVGRGYL